MIFADFGERYPYCTGDAGEAVWKNETGKTLTVVKAWASIGMDMGSTMDAQHIIYRTSDGLPIALEQTDGGPNRGSGWLTRPWEWKDGEILIQPDDGLNAHYYALAFKDNTLFNIKREQTRAAFRSFVWLKEY